LKRKSKGLFITFEGGEGAGKTTLITHVYDTLSEKGYQAVKTLEPGGTPLGLDIRKLLLHEQTTSICERAELFLFLADRAHHVKTVILPALEEGKIVLCDRFNDSTLAYQGVARHLDLSLLRSMCDIAAEGLTPDLTLYLDLDPKVGLERAKKHDVPDRLEKENLEFHNEVREGFLALALEEPDRFHTINAEQEIQEVKRRAMEEIETILCQK
jgi:dTMP kinase